MGVVFSHRDGEGFDALLEGVPLSGKLILRQPGAELRGVTTVLAAIPARRPDYVAYQVCDRKDRDGKSRWRKIGHGYRHSNGLGIDILYKVVPINGKITLRPNKAE